MFFLSLTMLFSIFFALEFFLRDFTLILFPTELLMDTPKNIHPVFYLMLMLFLRIYTSFALYIVT